MATLILGVVGRVILGPVGGIIGSFVGAGVDRRLFGGRRTAGRQATPEIQAASYGEPIPVVRGRMRVSGNLIWAAPVRETVSRSGGGKRGPATTSYAYSASFAVLLCAGAISGVGRVWADGKLMRDAAGQWIMPATMRVHLGSERQSVDPLIAAAEGVAPAFRGIAYAVFEDLPLAEFGNRLPNLSFEVLADDGPIGLGEALTDLAASAGVTLETQGAMPAVTGVYAGSAAPLADVLAPILRTTGATMARGTRIIGSGAVVVPLTPGGLLHSAPAAAGRAGARDRQRRAAASATPDVIEISYYDADRDYHPGLQRARLRGGDRVEATGLPLVLDAAAAKQLATDMLVRAAIGGQQRTLRLPWRFLGLQPGDSIGLPDGVWRVTECRFEAFVLTLELVRAAAALPAAPPSDGGRVLVHEDVPAGPTTLAVLDLPPLPGELPDRPRLWLAGAGSGAGWRRAGVAISLDDGASFDLAATLSAPAIMGAALTTLPAAPPASWDPISSVEVELLAPAMWLESRSRDAVLAGANMAVLGDEILQFETALPLGGRRFRLSGLLRGRRGTEWAVGGHAAGERFVLLDPGVLVPLALPLEQAGARLLLRPLGTGDGEAAAIPVVLGSEAVRPLAPVHVRAVRTGGELQFDWIAQSRAGFGWPDLTDVPLGEAAPAWRVSLRDAAGTVDGGDVVIPMWRCANRAGPLWFDVAQIGATLGRSASLFLP